MGGNMKQYSEEHEKQVRDIIKIVYPKTYKVSNSGAPDFKVGDVTFDHGLIECKTKKKEVKSQKVKKEWFDKLMEEAVFKNKDLASVVINFGGDQNYFILNEQDFLEMLYAYKLYKESE